MATPIPCGIHANDCYVRPARPTRTLSPVPADLGRTGFKIPVLGLPEIKGDLTTAMGRGPRAHSHPAVHLDGIQRIALAAPAHLFGRTGNGVGIKNASSLAGDHALREYLRESDRDLSLDPTEPDPTRGRP